MSDQRQDTRKHGVRQDSRVSAGLHPDAAALAFDGVDASPDRGRSDAQRSEVALNTAPRNASSPPNFHTRLSVS